MRYLLIIILLPSVAFGQIEVEEDEFTGRVTYVSEEARPLFVEEGEAEKALYQALCLDGKFALNFLLFFDAIPPSYTQLYAYFLIDGEREEFSITNKNTKRGSGKVVSIGTVFIEGNMFKKISEADTVRLKIGDNIFGMPMTARHDMREIVKEYTLVNRSLD